MPPAKGPKPGIGGPEIKPFLPLVHNPTRPLGAVLPAIETPEPVSPWLPKPVAEAPISAPAAPAAPTADEITQLLDDARDTGRAEGLAETQALRAQLKALIDQLAAAHAAIVAPAAADIADAATCVIESWLGHADRAQLFKPVIERWLAATAPSETAAGEHPAPAPIASVRIHPSDLAAVTSLVTDAAGGVKLAITGDAGLPPGAIEIKSAVLELSHSWQARLPDLRAAIAGALTGTDAADDRHDDDVVDRRPRAPRREPS